MVAHGALDAAAVAVHGALDAAFRGACSEALGVQTASDAGVGAVAVHGALDAVDVHSELLRASDAAAEYALDGTLQDGASVRLDALVASLDVLQLHKRQSDNRVQPILVCAHRPIPLRSP